MQVPKSQGFEGSGDLPGPAEGERLGVNAHPKKNLKFGSSNCLKFTEMVNFIIITLFCIILNISFAIPSRGPFWLLRGCVHNRHTEFLSKLGSLAMKNERNVAVSLKVLHALHMLTIVLQGQANLNVCASKLARRLELLSSIKDGNDNDASALIPKTIINFAFG